MEEVFKIKLSKATKDEMDKYRIDWSKYLRNYIEAKLKRLKLLKTLEKMSANAKLMKVKVDSSDIIKDYRNRR